MSDSRAMARGGRGWPLQAYFAAVGVVVVVAGVAAAGYVSVQSNTDARQAAITDVGLAASKAATQIDAGLKVIDSTSTPLVTNDAAMRSLFSRPTACSL